MDQRQKAFNDICKDYGFEPDDYEREFETYGLRGDMNKVKLVGFEGERCLLEIQRGKHDQKTRGHFIRELPSDCMRHMRVYYRDMAQKCREERLTSAAQFYEHLVLRMTKKMENAGWDAHPTKLFNAFGNPESARLALGQGKKTGPSARAYIATFW